jgi:hypothetical protein
MLATQRSTIPCRIDTCSFECTLLKKMTSMSAPSMGKFYNANIMVWERMSRTM